MLTDQMLVAKAADFSWFIFNTKSRYQKTQLSMPPLEFLLKSRQQMTVQMQNRVQNQQTQLQTQQQIQLQIQNQIQNPIQIQTTGGMGA